MVWTIPSKIKFFSPSKVAPMVHTVSSGFTCSFNIDGILNSCAIFSNKDEIYEFEKNYLVFISVITIDNYPPECLSVGSHFHLNGASVKIAEGEILEPIFEESQKDYFERTSNDCQTYF